MGKSVRKLKESPAQYYDRRGVLVGLDARPVEFALEEELRRQILKGERALENVFGVGQAALEEQNSAQIQQELGVLRTVLKRLAENCLGFGVTALAAQRAGVLGGSGQANQQRDGKGAGRTHSY